MEILAECARRIELLLLDVDGVMTDGRILSLPGGAEGKFFHIHDGYGIHQLQASGLPIGFLSARPSEATTARAEELDLAVCVQDARDKLAVARAIVAERGLTLEQVAFMGDDVLDVPLLGAVGLGVAPANARHGTLSAPADVAPSWLCVALPDAAGVHATSSMGGSSSLASFTT